ncbi:MAG TPA: fibronectin type III domain-containing protein [bacterium]|nr:fibronectin type III domain-containing protein [bacterium]
MKKAIVCMAAGLAAALLVGFIVMSCLPGHDREKGGGVAGPVIPGPGQPGYDSELGDITDLMFRQFALLNGSGIGVGFNDFVVGDDTDKDVVTRWFLQWPVIGDFGDWCDQDGVCNGMYTRLNDDQRDGLPGPIKWLSGNGDTGMFGGVAIGADLLRYAVMRDQGYPDDEVEKARQRAIHVLDVIDINGRIHGVPGVLVRGLRRLDHGPAWPPGDYTPCPPRPTPPKHTEKWNTWHEDNSAGCTDGGTPLPGLYPDWAWQDNASKDQVDGWIFALGVAWDVIAEDPAIPQYYRDMLQTIARNFAANLMSPDPEWGGADMTIRDADGKLTQWCDLNPHILNMEGCWSAGYSPVPVNPFNAIMGLGAVRVLLHITGDEEIRDFYYQELIGKRQWHLFLRDADMPYVDFTYATNYSNVNMIFLAFYNVLRYETDPQVRLVVQQAFERLWDNGRNNRQPKQINQTFFDVMYSGLRFGGPAPWEVAEGIETLKQWPAMPMWAQGNIINCDEEELAQGECLAVDNQTIIELPVKEDPALYQYYEGAGSICAGKQKRGLGHNDEIVAAHLVPRRLRGDSNFDWRSNPFSVNFCQSVYQINSVNDVIAAYWLGRFLTNEPGPLRNLSPAGRYPVAPEAPADLMATPMSESQINLAWTDATNKEDGFVIERRKASETAFTTVAEAGRDIASYSDTGLAPSTTYVYRVKANNDAGDSGYSNTAPATTFLGPDHPPAGAANLTAAAQDHQSILLAWDDMSADEMGFKIIREGTGTVGMVLAGVTQFLDTGLADGTLYRYTVVAYNSAGDAWPSNTAEDTTVDLPGIDARSPDENESEVSIYTDEIIVDFDDPITSAQLIFKVRDEVSEISGGWTLTGGGYTASFYPDSLLTMSTQYGCSVTVDGFLYEYVFYTEGPSWIVDLEDAPGISFAVNVFRANIVEPADAADLLGALLGQNIYLLLELINIDVPGNKFDLLGGLGDQDAPDPTTQDMQSPTILFPESADFNLNSFTVGPFPLPITIEGYLVTLDNVVLTGSFAPDYEYIGNASLEGYLDLRTVILAIGENPDDYIPMICGLAPGICEACLAEPLRAECIHLKVTDIRGDVRTDALGDPIPVIPVAAVQALASGTGAVRTLELTLLEPLTGAPEPGRDLYLFVDSGNGTFVLNGSTAIIVQTDANGKALVGLSDTDGGLDSIKIDINVATTPVPYNWARSGINVSFD